MTLYRRTLVTVTATLVALFALLYVTAQVIVMRGFEEIEARAVTTNIQRACGALEDSLNSFKSIALGWSKWDDTYNFVNNRNQEFIDRNLIDSTFYDSKLNLMVILDQQAEIVYSKTLDLESNKSLPLPEVLKTHFQVGDVLVTHPDANSARQGFIKLADSYLMVVSLPILTSLGEGPINGTLIWGRFLDQAQLAYFSEQLRLNISLTPYDESILQHANLIEQLTDFHSISYYMEPINPSQSKGYTTLFDIFGKPTAILTLDLTRSVYMQGQTTLSYFLVALLMIGCVFTILTAFELERNVLRRLSGLSKQVKEIQNTGNLKSHIHVKGSDEITTLGTVIQSMLHAMDKSRTKLQNAYGRLKEVNDHLEQRVAARTADLTEAIALLRLEVAERRQAEELLAQAHEQALEALRLKTQILSNVSHDARTPLTAIMLHAELMQRGTYGTITEKQEQRLNSIMVSARQLLGFINNLLGEAQLSSGNLQLNMAPLSPTQLMRDIGLITIPLAERKELKMSLEVAPSVPSQIVSDADRLRQIITNLCDNAIKFTTSGQISVLLTKKDTDHLLLTVKDTGRGIPRDALERIFEAFWQVDGSSTRDVNRGVGLGLSIVKQLVTAMNGIITVDSELGKGTTFTIQLPLLLPEPEFTTSVA